MNGVNWQAPPDTNGAIQIIGASSRNTLTVKGSQLDKWGIGEGFIVLEYSSGAYQIFPWSAVETVYYMPTSDSVDAMHGKAGTGRPQT